VASPVGICDNDATGAPQDPQNRASPATSAEHSRHRANQPES